MIRKIYRGSRKHVLDLVERKDFLKVVNNLLRNSGTTVSDEDIYIPKGYNEPEKMELRDFGPKYLANQLDRSIIRKWWPDHPAKSPQWGRNGGDVETEGTSYIVPVKKKSNKK